MSTTAIEPGGRRRFEHDVVPELPFLIQICRSLSSSDVEAEELAQEVLRRGHEAFDGREGGSVKAWLYQIACRSAERGTRSGTRRDADRSALGQALADLRPRYRQVVDLVDVHGLGYEETAEALGIPVGTVTRRLHRGRSRLRRACRTPIGTGPGRTLSGPPPDGPGR